MTTPLPGSTHSTGYVVIENNGQTTERFIGAKASFAQSIQIYAEDNGTVLGEIRRIRGRIDILPGEVLRLEEGRLYLKFLKVKGGIEPGQLRTVKLLFENAGIIEVEFWVERQ